MNKLEKIRETTGFEFNKIIDMNSKEFFFNITGLYMRGKITKVQHDWLQRQRTGKGLDQLTLSAIDIFNGQIVSK